MWAAPGAAGRVAVRTMNDSMQEEASGRGLGAAQSGSEQYRQFYAAAFGPLVAQLFAVTGDLGEAQDAAQEAFIRAWQRWSRVSRYENPHAWVRTVGYRLAVSRWRRIRNAHVSWIRYGSPPDLPAPEPTSVMLVEALKQLPETQRRSLVLHYLGGLSVEQIATTEGCAAGTVKARLSRGRAALADVLRDIPANEERVTRRPSPVPIEAHDRTEGVPHG